MTNHDDPEAFEAILRAIHARPPADRRAASAAARAELDEIEALLKSDRALDPKRSHRRPAARDRG